jgi:hypothetical protein
MSIGLTSEQLSNAFMESLTKRLNDMNLDLSLAKMGLPSKLVSALEEFKTKNPGINPEQVAIIFMIFNSFMDTIARNNEELAKSIPHIDH